MSREDFVNPIARQDILSQIEKEAPKYLGNEILLCFTCDPYCQLDEELRLTRETIKILHKNNITVHILTKGGKKSERDFDLLLANRNQSWYGATLTFIDNKHSKLYEPNASLPKERFEVLRRAFVYGIKTWVSLEPVIDPEQTLEIIRQTHSFINKYKIGKWNYSKEADKIDWKAFINDAIELLERYNSKYYIKKDLLPYVEEKKI